MVFDQGLAQWQLVTVAVLGTAAFTVMLVSGPWLSDDLRIKGTSGTITLKEPARREQAFILGLTTGSWKRWSLRGTAASPRAAISGPALPIDPQSREPD
jgi:hypothetical protein